MSANYEQPEYLDKRIRYFLGQFLTAQDFIDEQKYHIDRQRRGDRLLKVSGIGEGLKVTAQGVATALLETGTAIDPKGRLVVLAAEKKIDLAKYKNKAPYLVISYQETESDPSQSGSEGNRRWDETPKIDLVLETEDLPQDAVVLAKLNLDTDGMVTVDTSVRQYSGIYLPSGDSLNDTKLGPTLRSGGDSNSNLAVLTGDLNVTGNLSAGNLSAGNFSTSGNLSVTGNLSANGNVGIGIANTSEKLEVNGTIKCQEIKLQNTIIRETDWQNLQNLQNLQSHIIIVGMIVMWSGAIDNIPSGWALCNGDNGTPDLTDRFLVGAGQNFSPNSSGEADKHSHAVGDKSWNTSRAGSHYHTYMSPNISGPNSRMFTDGSWKIRTGNNSLITDNEGDHSHQVNMSSYQTAENSGENKPRWYALCFIIKL